MKYQFLKMPTFLLTPGEQPQTRFRSNLRSAYTQSTTAGTHDTEVRITNNEQRTTNNEQRTTNNEQRTLLENTLFYY